ncbi:helix-turn-helix domain-containing protein [Aequorivita capsosiphonis]|uniref:helix-turn-helix domain-containing protein n=1 Tax=Aequorivita capsosiphonis TaxID=487317 RepID=UPI0003F6EE53|nr:AraC family transcriptional regulator [Aequorivita capsosiphonis]
METLKICGRIQEINTESIQTCLISAYQKGQVFEEINYCMECGQLILFQSKILKASGILIREVKSIQSSDITEGLEISGESIIMRFIIKADKERPTHNIIYGSNSNTCFVKTYRETDSIFMIILSREFYFNLIPHSYESHKEFASHVINETTSKLFVSDLPIDPLIGGIINEIKKCKREGLFKRIFIENKVQELLLIQLELYLHQQKYKDTVGFNEDEITKVCQAKLILDSSFTDAPTICALSKKVFLNETKLRKDFKSYYSVTIKNYIISLKMNYALRLLCEKKHNITEIAEMCGYNGLVQFSVAFKKFYGCSPKKYQI